MRKFLKRRMGLIPEDALERALALSILANKYGGLLDLKRFEGRKELWKDVFDRYSGRAITLLEFGVFKGNSIAQFASMNSNPESCFVGFDSFRGLPEDWFATMDKGMFDLNGEVPQVDDKRVRFVNGWFQNTLPNFLAQTEVRGDLIVHYDADLYSATLFVLMQIDALKLPYLAIFDEFTGHETRALRNYQQMTGAKVEFIGKTLGYGFPEQVSCLIRPCAEYEV